MTTPCPRPKGIWLGECGYAPGVDELLRDSGIQYFFEDTHGVLFSDPRPRFERTDFGAHGLHVRLALYY